MFVKSSDQQRQLISHLFHKEGFKLATTVDNE